MPTLTLEPPKLAPPILKPTVIPLSIVRCTMIGDLMTNFGLDDNQTRIAQQGYADGLLSGLTIKGLDASGYVQDEATLMFADLAAEINVTVDVSGGRSMIEAVSRKLAHGVAFSVQRMKRRGLRITVTYHLSSKGMGDYHGTCNRLGLSAGGGGSTYAPGYAGRTLFTISPGLDRGTTYSHITATRIA